AVSLPSKLPLDGGRGRGRISALLPMSSIVTRSSIIAPKLLSPQHDQPGCQIPQALSPCSAIQPNLSFNFGRRHSPEKIMLHHILAYHCGRQRRGGPMETVTACEPSWPELTGAGLRGLKLPRLRPTQNHGWVGLYRGPLRSPRP